MGSDTSEPVEDDTLGIELCELSVCGVCGRRADSPVNPDLLFNLPIIIRAL